MTFTTRTTLGTTGIEVGPLGIASSYRAPQRAYQEAFERGCNYFTWGSFIRGRNAGLAGMLQASIADGKRADLVLAVISYAHSAWLTERSLRRGLAKLGTDYADVLILGYFSRRPRQSLIDGARKLKELGMVRAVGISTHNRSVIPKLHQEQAFDLYHVRYNAVHRGAEKDVFPQVEGEGKPGLVAFTATCWRKLLDPKKMPSGELPATAVDCYRYALSHPAVDVCLAGPSNLSQMRENLAVLDSGPMSEGGLARMRRIGDHIYSKPR
jgi:aryl-alcohol dehydrogenase-like predicted oxidoreductase